ncbi:MAG: HEPN domain-containing protein [bacterium]
MNDKDALFVYRFNQAEETLSDAKKMLENNLSPRSIINRAYYAIFYAILALFLKNSLSIKTSKHTGIISIFDKEFVHKGRIDKSYSKMLHRMFDLRQECDYKELVATSKEDAILSIKQAEEFIKTIRDFISKEIGGE